MGSPCEWDYCAGVQVAHWVDLGIYVQTRRRIPAQNLRKLGERLRSGSSKGAMFSAHSHFLLPTVLSRLRPVAPSG